MKVYRQESETRHVMPYVLSTDTSRLAEIHNQNNDDSIEQYPAQKRRRLFWSRQHPRGISVALLVIISVTLLEEVASFSTSCKSFSTLKFTKPVDGNLRLSLFSSEQEDQTGGDEDHVSRSFSVSSMAGIEPQVLVSEESGESVAKFVDWDVYVDQSKASLERGASATLDAFTRLAPPQVKIHPAILPKTKAKAPVVRCIFQGKGKDAKTLEVGNVDSVDKVYRVLSHHLRVKNVNSDARESLKWKYKGNEHLEASEIPSAIEAYDKALQTGFTDQEGIILLMRATAYLQRAVSHRKELKDAVNDLAESVPSISKVEFMYEEAAQRPSLTNSILQRVLSDTRNQEKMFQKTQYRHGLYQYALLQAAQDSLRATQLLPKSSRSWIRAGEILSELWKLKESAQYYEKAIEIDPSLEEKLTPVINRLRNRQELVDNARAYGWSEDSLRLALDVAG